MEIPQRHWQYIFLNAPKISKSQIGYLIKKYYCNRPWPILFISSMVLKRHPFNNYFNYGNKKKSVELRSGDWEGWERTAIRFLARNLRIDRVFDFEAKIRSTQLHWNKKKRRANITLTLDRDCRALFRRRDFC